MSCAGSASPATTTGSSRWRPRCPAFLRAPLRHPARGAAPRRQSAPDAAPCTLVSPGGLALGDQGVGDLDERPGDLKALGRGPQLLRLASPRRRNAGKLKSLSLLASVRCFPQLFSSSVMRS